MIKFITDIWLYLTALMFPQKCVNCDKPALYNGVLCGECKESLELEIKEGCRNCNRPFSLCRCKPTYLKEKTLISCSPYKRENSVCRELILLCKKRKNRETADEFAHKICTIMKENGLDGNWTVTYVPRSPDAVRTKGHDQAKMLAKRLSRISGNPFLGTLKCRETYKEQKTLKLSERSINAFLRFYVPKRRIRKIKGKSFILIDDVVTSGTTAKRCMELLEHYGAERAICICASRSVKYIDIIETEEI